MNTKASSANPNATNTSVDEILGDTGLGKFIAQNKALTIGFVALIILGVFAFGFFQSQQKAQNKEAADQVFAFKENAVLDTEAKDFSATKLHQDTLNLLENVQDYDGVVESVLISSEVLREAGNLELAKQVVEKAIESTSGAQALYFLRNRLASLYEDLGENEKALELYNKTLASGSYYLEDQLYFNIGRLELSLGNTEKARKSFEYVVNKGEKAEGEFLKLSKLYLQYKLNK